MHQKLKRRKLHWKKVNLLSKLAIDVSYHNGIIDWEKVKSAVSYAIIRCGYGQDQTNQDDKQWARNVSECERLGIPYGVYFYSYAKSTSRIQGEINHCLRLLKGHSPQLPVYFDSEEPGTQNVARANAKAFCDAMIANGYKAGIYASRFWYQSYIKESWGYSLWIASYGSKSAGVDGIDMWQYTSRGSVPGVGKNVDMNYVYRDFGSASPVQPVTKPVDESWKGNAAYYLENDLVKPWQRAMNKGFDTTELKTDGKFGKNSQAFAKNHLLWYGQTHNCITAIKWLRRTLRDVYGFTKLSYNEGWTDYLTKCVKVFQSNRGLEHDGKVGLITTYWLLSGKRR